MIAAAALAAFWVSSAGQAAVRAPAPTLAVSVAVDGCPFLRSDDVGRLAALELDVPVVAAAAAGEQVTRIVVACAGERIEITVVDPVTGKQLTRALALAAHERNVATRLIAIAASELVITSWIALTLPQASVSPIGKVATSPELQGAAQERASRHFPRAGGTGYVLLLANAIGPFSGIGLSWGGGLRLGWTAGAGRPPSPQTSLVLRLGADLDLAAARAEVNAALGTAHVSMWSTALRASVRLYRGRAWLDTGLGARLGLARMEGVPFDATATRGGTLAGTWGGPIVYVGTGLRLWRLVLTAGVEAGFVLREVSGLVDEGTAVSVSGRWLSGTVGIGWGA